MTEEELLNCIDAAISAGSHQTDFRLTAIISLRLCEFLEDLDEQQREALDVARAYWGGSGSDAERLRSVHAIAVKRDANLHAGKGRSKQGYANQLVWSALNVNTPLSGFAGEFLVELGLGSGLSVEQIAAVFRQNFPGSQKSD